MSTLLSGICIFGGAGFGLDHLFGTRPVLMAVGILAGVGMGIYLVYARYFHDYARAEAAVLRTPAAAGWSRHASVAGGAGEPHPPTPELANWPNVKHAADGAKRLPGRDGAKRLPGRDGAKRLPREEAPHAS